MHRIEQFTGTYFFLSMFFRHPIPGAHNITYPSAIAAFHAGKTDDQQIRRSLAAASAPQVADRRGRRLPLPLDWDIRQHKVMRAIQLAKFSDLVLAQRLLDTGEAILVHGNLQHDMTWGWCRCGRLCCAGIGENWLGRHLMQIRAELRSVRVDDTPIAA